MKLLPKIALASLLASSLAHAGMQTWHDPFDEDFAKIQQYMNSLIEQHMSASAIGNYNYPRTNIQDTKEKIVLEFDLAGVPKENIKLSIDENNVLTLEGKKENKVEQKDKDGNYVRREIFYGSFQRVIQLPENIIQEKLTTKFENGILTATIPKKEIKKPKAKVIPIN